MGNEKLTMLLTLKGRHKYTSRWINYITDVVDRPNIAIADGSLDDDATHIVESYVKEHPDINIRYTRYPPDKELSDFYEKMVRAISDIHTPYVILADNDDFYETNTLRNCVDFLETHPGYIACRGGVLHFNVTPADGKIDFPVYGRGGYWFNYECFQPLEQCTAAERLLAHGSVYAPTWYSVVKTDALLHCFSVANALNLTDLTLLEPLVSMMLLSKGKIRQIDEPMLFRQYNTDFKTSDTIRAISEQIDRMFADSWCKESNGVISEVAKLVADADGLDPSESKEVVRAAMVEYERNRILRQSLALLKTQKHRWRDYSRQIVAPVVRHRFAAMLYRLGLGNVLLHGSSGRAFGRIIKYIKYGHH